MCAARLGWADDLNEMFYEANMDEIMHDIMSTVRDYRTSLASSVPLLAQPDP